MQKKLNHIKIINGIYLVGRGIWGYLRPLTDISDCNIFLIDGGGKEFALIDAGANLLCIKLIENIRSVVKDIRKIKRIIITHNHVDHIGGLIYLKRKIKYKLLAGKGSYYKNLKINSYLKEGSKVKVGNIVFKAINIPGHTPDSIALITKINDKKIIFAGDTAIGDQKKIAKGVVGWYDAHWGSDLAKYKKSIRRLLNLNADILIPSHGMWQKGKKNVRKSLKNCLLRLSLFGKFPEIKSIIPLDLANHKNTFKLYSNVIK